MNPSGRARLYRQMVLTSLFLLFQGPLVAKGAEVVHYLLQQGPRIASYPTTPPLLEEARRAKGLVSFVPPVSLREEASLRALAAFLYRDKTTRVSYQEALRIVRICHEKSLDHQVPTERLVALILVESAGNAEAVSQVGARGLMQVMPETAIFIAKQRQDHSTRARLGRGALFEEETNIDYGAWYYTYLVDYFQGSERKALAAYNWGPGAIKERLAKGESLPQIYWQKVLQVESRIKKDWTHEAELYFWSSGPGGTFYEGDIRDAREPQHRAVPRPVLRRDGESLPGWEGAAVSSFRRRLLERG